MTRVGCTGVFDYIIHKGHISFLDEVRSYGDEVIVFLGADSYIVKRKKRRPFYNQERRAKNLNELVDEVICFRGDTFIEIYRILRCKLDIFIFGDNQIDKWFSVLGFLLRITGIKCFRETSDRIESTTDLLVQAGLLEELKL